MSKRLIGALLVGFLSLASGSAFAVLTPTWDNASTNASTSDFDDGTLTFERVFAGCIEIVNEADGIYHDHSEGAVDFIMEVRVNNAWQQVYSDTTLGDEEDNPLSDVPKVSFTAGYVDAVRLYVDPFVDYGFHDVPNGMQFDLTTGGECGAVKPVPAGSPAGLLLLITLILGLTAWQINQRRQQI